MSEFDDLLTPDVRFHLVHKMERHKVVALAGPRLLPHEEKYLQLHNASGVILFSRNLQSLSQVSDLVAAVNEHLAVDDVPALVMADHEGDMVAELRSIIGAPPSALAIAATGDLELAREVARETGAVMRKLGANVVLAPVADLYIDAASPITGLRAFGRDPQRVAAFMAASVEGFRAAGIACCAKHFPGHGDTPEDSHETLPEVRRSLDQLAAEDLIPFRSAIEAGVEMVMMSHVAFPLEREELVPASFDARMIGGTLRNTLEFDGVVITDALEMAPARWYAQRGFGGLAGGFERSLLAGSDLLLHTRPVPEHVQVEGAASPVLSIDVMGTIIKTLEKVVDRGRVDEKLAQAATENEALKNILNILGASDDRVMQLRRALAQTAAPRPASGGKVIELGAFPTVPSVYRDVAARSILAPAGWDPQKGSDLAAGPAVVMPIQWSPGESIKKQELDAFLDVLTRHFPDWERTGCAVGFTGDGEDVEPVLEPSGRRTVVDASRYGGSGGGGGGVELTPEDAFIVVVSSRGLPDEAFAAALERFLASNEPDLIVVTGWPWHDWAPEGVPVLLTLGASPQCAAALAQVVVGEVDPSELPEGLLPPPPAL